jgi:hypothetical protein
LLEVETERQEIDFSDNVSDVDHEDTAETLQLGLDFTLSDMINAEFVIDYEAETGHLELDEGVINLEGETWGVSAGRLYVPFGEYYSHFVTGPLLEFGETRSSAALAADYSPINIFEIFVYAFEGDAGETGRSRNAVDWGVGFELNSLDELWKFGAGYLSDLAESDALLLDDFDNRYENRVGGWNIYILRGMEPFEFTLEAVAAAGHYRELDASEDEPWAANLEIAWFSRVRQFSSPPVWSAVANWRMSRSGSTISRLPGGLVNISASRWITCTGSTRTTLCLTMTIMSWISATCLPPSLTWNSEVWIMRIYSVTGMGTVPAPRMNNHPTLLHAANA